MSIMTPQILEFVDSSKKKKKKKIDANKKIHSLYIMGYKILKKRNLFLGEAILNKKREKTTKY